MRWRRQNSKAMEDLFDREGEFWAEQKAIILAAIVPVFTRSFFEGARLARLEFPKASGKDDDMPLVGTKRGPRRPRPDIAIDVGTDLAGDLIDVQRLMEAAPHTLATYTNQWWDRFDAATQKAIRKTIAEARDLGEGPKWVASELADYFSPERAARVAITETTNLMGAGAQAEYKVLGIHEWSWQTVNDDAVCEVCDGLDGNVFPMSESFEAAHPGCRCWPLSSGDVEGL